MFFNFNDWVKIYNFLNCDYSLFDFFIPSSNVSNSTEWCRDPNIQSQLPKQIQNFYRGVQMQLNGVIDVGLVKSNIFSNHRQYLIPI